MKDHTPLPPPPERHRGPQQKPSQEALIRQHSWTASLAPQQRGGEGHPVTRSLKMGGWAAAAG